MEQKRNSMEQKMNSIVQKRNSIKGCLTEKEASTCMRVVLGILALDRVVLWVGLSTLTRGGQGVA